MNNENNIAIYAYDQWGKPTQMRKPTSTTVDLVNYNPFLYRGYVYDSDSGLYYLQSRYYDPVTGRFLNADVLMNMDSALGSNLYAYCENNSINSIDVSGYYTFRVGKSHYYHDEIYFFMYLSDLDVRAIKLGVTTAQILYGSILGILAAILGFASFGIASLVCAVVGIVVEAVLGLINAYIDYANHGKGATITIFIRCGTKTIYYPVWQRTRYGYWKLSIRKGVGSYFYFSRVPTIIWGK